jgi:hypothetical protein
LHEADVRICFTSDWRHLASENSSKAAVLHVPRAFEN